MSEQSNPTLDAILQKRRRQRMLRVAGAVGVVAIAGALYYWIGRGEEGVEPVSPAPLATPVAPSAPAEPAPPIEPPPLESVAASTEEARPLPKLRESDGFVREGVARLSSRPEWVAWLASDELLRRFVAAVDAIAQGESPAEQAPRSMRPVGRFEVESSPSGSVASAASFARYDALTTVLTSLDVKGLVASRRELAPLLEEAYHDLGHPDRTFDQALRDALFSLLTTPEIVGAPALEPLTLGHGYVDPALEDLSAAKKQLLRFGPANVARLQQKIREVAVALGIPEAELPRTPRYEVAPSR